MPNRILSSFVSHLSSFPRSPRPSWSFVPSCLRVYVVLLSSFVFCLSSFAAAPPLTLTIHDTFQPALPGTVHLTGHLGDKLDLCIRARLLAQDIDAVVMPYQLKHEIGGGDWRSEYWGKWYTSLCLADAYHTTDATQAVRDAAEKALIATAAPDGYLGSRQPQYRTQGWDVWGCKYALLGVLAYYDRTGDKSALDVARRHADVLIAELGPGKTNIENVGEWNGMAASSVLEPIVQLYERTGDQKYLAFAQHIVACWNLPSNHLKHGMRLVDDALAGKAPTKMFSPKAYEMMSCFEGLCELYRATGQKEYLQAPINLAAAIQIHEDTLVGCGTSGELWCDGAKKQTAVVEKPMETCVTATWMKLDYQLLRLTGDERYAEELEKNLYNGLLGAMMPHGRWWAYFSGLMGVRVPSYIQHDDVGLSCCVVNGPRGLMITPFWAFMNSADGPVINLYSPGIAQVLSPYGQPVGLEIQGDYPVGDHTDILITPAQPEQFTLALRIPAWSTNTALTVNNEKIPVQPGTYAKIHRTWQSGDHISITFDMRGRILEAPDGNGQVAIARGPIVLSLDDRLLPPATGHATIDRKTFPFIDLISNPEAAAKINAWMAFDAPFTVDGTPQTLTFCDYADAGNAFSQQNVFRTWLPQPLDLHTLYNTGQNVVSTLSHVNHWTNPPAEPIRVDDPDHDLALAIHGATATSDSEFDREPNSTHKVTDGILATPENFSNRWHSSITTPHPHWIQIKLPKPAAIATIILNFADPDGYPVSFQGIVSVAGKDQEIFNVADNKETRIYRTTIAPVVTDTFRLIIRSSANPKYPNAAQISEIQLFPPEQK